MPKISSRPIFERVDALQRKRLAQLTLRARRVLTLSEIRERLEAGDIDAVAEPMETAFRDFGTGLALAYLLTSTTVTERLVGRLETFDPSSPEAIEQTAAITQRVEEELVSGVRPSLLAVLVGIPGAITLNTARAARDAMGLHVSQVESVMALRARLEAASSAAVAESIASAQAVASVGEIGVEIRVGGLASGQLDRLTSAHLNRHAVARISRLAANEGRRVTGQAVESVVQLGQRQGKFIRSSQVWNQVDRPTKRDIHETMNGQERSIGELFDSGSGAQLRFPRDPDAPIADTVNCICWLETNVVRA